MTPEVQELYLNFTRKQLEGLDNTIASIKSGTNQQDALLAMNNNLVKDLGTIVNEFVNNSLDKKNHPNNIQNSLEEFKTACTQGGNINGQDVPKLIDSDPNVDNIFKDAINKLNTPNQAIKTNGAQSLRPPAQQGR